MNSVIDKNVREKRHGVDWDDWGKEGVIGLGKGFASSGGLIPYTGKLTENAIREHCFD